MLEPVAELPNELVKRGDHASPHAIWEPGYNRMLWTALRRKAAYLPG
jgi:hypothetical protein